MENERLVIRHSGIEPAQPKKTFSLNQKSIDQLETALLSLQTLHEKVNPDEGSEIALHFKEIQQLMVEAKDSL